MAAFENHVYLNSIEQFPEFQYDDINKKIQNNILKILDKICPLD